MRIKLPSGGTAKVSSHVKPETVHALDQLVRAAARHHAERRNAVEETEQESIERQLLNRIHQAKELAEQLPKSRAAAVVITKLDEARLWAVDSFVPTSEPIPPATATSAG